MTWKAGDIVPLEVYLETNAGAPVNYSSWSTFLSAGWTALFYNGSTVLASQPTITLSPIGATGYNTLTFALPSTPITHLLFSAPAGFRSDPSDILLVVPTSDTDSLAASVVSAIGGPTSSSGFQSSSFSSIEGDNMVPQVFTVPLAALQMLDTTGNTVFQYNDLSDIGGNPWTIAASARGTWPAGQLPGNAVAFSYDAIIASKINRQVAIGFYSTVPTGAKVVNPDGTPDTTGASASTVYKLDIQLIPPAGSTYAGRKLTVVGATHTVYRQQTTSP